MKESSKLYSPEVTKKIEETRKRVDNLRLTDNYSQDSVYDIAKEEDRVQKMFADDGIPKELAKVYAEMFSTAVLEKLEAQKEKWLDELTGLKNKAALNGEVPIMMNLERRNGKDCSVLMLDLDHFKEINDSVGHPGGDQALMIIADIFRNSVRKSDIVYRFGGEEFTIVLFGVRSEDAQKIAENIRSTVEKSGIVVFDKNQRQRELKCTVSIGCIGTDQLSDWNKRDEWEKRNEDKGSKDDAKEILDDMIQSADGALYFSKDNGRNRVTVFDSQKMEKKKQEA